MRLRAGVGGDFSRRVRAARLLTASFSPLLVLLACSGEDDVSKGKNVNLGAAKPLIDALCSMARNCCMAAGFPAGPLSDCEPEMLRQNDWFTAIANGTVDIHEPEFSQCVANYERIATSCTFEDDAFEPCRLATTGRATEGEACEDAIECLRTTGPVACAREHPNEIGTCATLLRGSAGQTCILTAGEGDYGVTYGTDVLVTPLAYCDLRDGLFCDWGIDGGTCAPVPGAGAACDFDCAPGLSCIDDVCVTPGANGSTCTTSSECESQYCPEGGLCETPPVASEKVCGGDFN